MRLARLAFIGSLSVVALVAQGCGGDDETPAATATGGSSGTAGVANGGDGNGGEGNAGEGNGGEGNGGEGNGGEGNGGEGPGDAAAGTPGDGDGDGGDGDGGDGDGDGGEGDGGTTDGGNPMSDASTVYEGDAALLTDAGNSFFCPGVASNGDTCLNFLDGTECQYTGGVQCTCVNPMGPNNTPWECTQ
jgi:hypothetical protein